MGEFRVTVMATGNHGCQRGKSGTDIINGCGEPSCTDCITRRYLTALKASGAIVQEAYILHWPGSHLRTDGLSGEVLDNLLVERRLGRF